MTMTNIPGIAFEIDNGIVTLEQDDHCGDGQKFVTLHRSQIELIAQQMGLIGDPAPTFPRGFIRRFVRLGECAERLSDALNRKPCAFDPLERERLAGDLMTAFDEVFDDFGLGAAAYNEVTGMPPSAEPRVTPNNGNADDDGIAVTHPTGQKRGRRGSGDALSNAERQARHRAKKSQRSAPPPAGEPDLF